jgi:hypothetical protein
MPVTKIAMRKEIFAAVFVVILNRMLISQTDYLVNRLCFAMYHSRQCHGLLY